MTYTQRLIALDIAQQLRKQEARLDDLVSALQVTGQSATAIAHLQDVTACCAVMALEVINEANREPVQS
jgi:hypothetical protein